MGYIPLEITTIERFCQLLTFFPTEYIPQTESLQRHFNSTFTKNLQDYTSIGTSCHVRIISVSYTHLENRDYIWPIQASERVLTGGKLPQNPGWTDSTNFD